MRKGDVTIGWVLLLGFTVVLGITVSQWMRAQTEKHTQAMVKNVEDAAKCRDVAFNAYFTDSPSCTQINVTNTGYHMIAEIKVVHQYGVDQFTLNVKPEETVPQNLNTNGLDVALIPVVSVGKRMVSCADRRLVLACNP